LRPHALPAQRATEEERDEIGSRKSSQRLETLCGVDLLDDERHKPSLFFLNASINLAASPESLTTGKSGSMPTGSTDPGVFHFRRLHFAHWLGASSPAASQT
jgi:hypothetical protein